MLQNKKLQVFISSTYTDLQEERQAAVEAILRAGHIPAGMELFTAGDKSQLAVIQRWIDESDVYLLILGGRYGSIESESQKSYVQLEYEYASARGKPIFAIVIDDAYLKKRVKRAGARGAEPEQAQTKLRDFRAIVETKMVRFWSDPRDIKLAAMETLLEFSRRDELSGWVPGSQAVETQGMTEELTRLSKENAELRQGLSWLFKEADLINVEASVPVNSSVWVITPNLFRVMQMTDMSRVVKQNAERGVKYTYIYPEVDQNAFYEPALENIFSEHKDQFIKRPVKEDEFSSLAITHYLILNPHSIAGGPPRAFLDLPVEPRGYWIEVDSDGVQGLINRFYNTAHGLKQ